jgi:UDP-glucuronate 4-epimerase
MKDTILVTGAAGFIGSHLAERLVRLGYRVVGLDNFDDFYPPDVKRDNIRSLEAEEGFYMTEGDIRDTSLLARVFSENDIRRVAHLAARAGVRPSLEQPVLYQDVNIKGTINLLEASRTHGVSQFIFASSSSVYGLNGKAPFKEELNVNYPLSPYAASKASAELFCRTYSHLYSLPMVVIRPFTVYGPRQRPEMAIHHFTRMIDRDEEITIFGDGSTSRDYTYIGDIISGLEAALAYQGDLFQVFNLAAGRTVQIGYLLKLIEEAMGKKARVNYAMLSPGEGPLTLADISKAQTIIGYQPRVSIEEGVSLFVRWYLTKKCEVAV